MMSILTNRLKRESKTVEVMIGIYCKHHHGLNVLNCPECSELMQYAIDRLQHCPFQEGKTSCKNCPIHCYKPGIKDDVKRVMRYAGPRMMLRHPILTVFHFIDDRRKEPLIASPSGAASVGSDGDCPGPSATKRNQ